MSDTEGDMFAAEVSELFAARLKRFADWCETQWTLTVEEAERDKMNMTPEQVEGWNRVCQSMAGAASVWLEDFN